MSMLRAISRFALVLVVAIAAFTFIIWPRVPSDEKLRDSLVQNRASLEQLTQHALDARIEWMNGSSCGPSIDPAIEAKLREEMEDADVWMISVVDGDVWLTTYAWGLAVSQVTRGYFYQADGGAFAGTELGPHVIERKRYKRRVSGGWSIFGN